MFDRDSFLQIARDQFKDAYGFRPSMVLSNSWKEMSDAELMKLRDELDAAVEHSINEERIADYTAIKKWQGDLREYKQLGAKTLADAIRWDMMAYGIGNDDQEFCATYGYGYGHYCYKRGIPFRTERFIKRIMEK